jgi:hypothetical protein
VTRSPSQVQEERSRLVRGAARTPAQSALLTAYRVEHGIAHLKNWRALARHHGRREHMSDIVQAVAGLLSHQQSAACSRGWGSARRRPLPADAALPAGRRPARRGQHSSPRRATANRARGRLGSQRINVLLAAGKLVHVVRAYLTRIEINSPSSSGCCSRTWTSGSGG